MNEFIQFLTSKEIIAVYVISGVAFFICLCVYLFEKTSERVRRRHNTKELNKLVEEVREKLPVEEETISYNEPVLEPINEVSVTDLLDQVREEDNIEILDDVEEIEEETPVEEFQYTSIEPDVETARRELERLTKELEEEEKKTSMSLEEFEQEQEKNAIISIDELLEKGKQMYEANEFIQLEDEGNEPISIQDLEERVQKEKKVETPKVEKQEEVKRFKSTPFISPIFGIENNKIDNELELENTANYDKLDEQIKKSNDYIMSLKEFQKN